MTDSVKIHVIYTYKQKDQEHSIEETTKTVTDKEFLKQVLNDLSADEIRQLVKLSLCQLHCSKKRVGIPWLVKRNGSIFFDRNDMDYLEDEALINLRDEILQSKENEKTPQK